MIIFLPTYLLMIIFLPNLLSIGVILEYELRDKSREMKEIDLLHLTPE
jgi:dynein assembly factor with WDR repeat domains 1